MRALADLLGRIFLSFIFLVEAYETIVFPERTKATMTQFHILWQQDLLLYVSAVFLAFGSLMLLTGYRSTLGAALLLLYWTPVTFIVHNYFWDYPGNSELRVKGLFFMRDLAILGALLMHIGKGNNKYSIKRILATTKVK